MLNALRSARPLHQPSLSSFSLSNSNTHNITRTSPPSFIRFGQTASGEMDPEKQSKPESKTADTMSCFGEGYATRSDEEGFGGIYGGNQYVSKDGEEKDVYKEAHILNKDVMRFTEFDHNQGSEVKEKEKSRHQT